MSPWDKNLRLIYLCADKVREDFLCFEDFHDCMESYSINEMESIADSSAIETNKAIEKMLFAKSK